MVKTAQTFDIEEANRRGLPATDDNPGTRGDVDTVTILFATGFGARACKVVYGPDIKPDGYNAGSQFASVTADIGNLEDFYNLLCNVQEKQTALLIRGHIRSDVDPHNVRRTGPGNPNACFDDEPHHWVTIDCDDIEAPEDVDPLSLEAIEYLVSLLPPNFHDASYVYQWSNSAGFSRKIKVHLTFWLRQRQTCDALRDWARGWNATIGRELIDYRLYTPVQPHYVARPICKCPDPIPPHLRCGYVRKAADAVDLNLSRVPALRVRGGQDRRRPETAAVSQGGDGSLGQAFLRFPLPDAEIERDSATGLIIDGRERFITTTVFHVFWEMLRKRPPTPNALAERVWKIVQAQCDLQAQGKTWTYEDVLEKAQYIVAKYERGELPGGRGTRSGIDPYWSIDPIPVADARKHLKGRVKDFLDNPGEPGTGRIMVIAADPGAGKTEACLNAIAERWRDRPANIEYYVSTYALAEQIRRGLKERGVPARVFHGRNYVDPETKEPWCFRQEEANSLIAAGVSPARLLCQKPVVKRGPDGLEQKVTVKCQFYDQCRYQAERRETENQCEVRIFQHAYLTHHRSKSFPDPGLVIIDEKFFEQAHVTMTLNASDLGIRGNIAVVREVNYMIQSGLHSKQGLLSYLHQHNIGPDKLESARRAQFIREAKELSFDTSERLDISPEMSREEILKKIEGYKPGLQNIRIYSALIREMRAVATDPSFKPAENPHEVGTSEWVLLEQENIRAQRAALKPVRGHSHQLWLYHHDGKDMIGFSSRKKLPRLDSVPVIIIDAQADPAILAPLFGRRKIEFHRISVERKAIVTQITDRSVSKNSLLSSQERRQEAAEFISDLAIQGQRVLVVMSKKIRQVFTGETDKKLPPGTPLPFGGTVIHYGQERGLNDFKNFDAVVILGREELPAWQLERYRGLFWDDREPLKLTDGDLVRQVRGYDHPDRLGVEVRAHPDPRLDAILRQSREWSMVQALDRLRLADGKRERPVYILSNLPLPVPVDRLTTWDELVGQPEWLRLLNQTGILVLSPKILAQQFPNRFSTAKIAEHWIARDLRPRLPKAPNGQKETLVCPLGGNGTSVPQLVTFRRVKHRSNRSHPERQAIVAAGRDPHESLKAVLGYACEIVGTVPMTIPPKQTGSFIVHEGRVFHPVDWANTSLPFPEFFIRNRSDATDCLLEPAT